MDSLSGIVDFLFKIIDPFISEGRPLSQRLRLLCIALIILLIYNDITGCSAKKDTEYKMLQIEKIQIVLKDTSKIDNATRIKLIALQNDVLNNTSIIHSAITNFKSFIYSLLSSSHPIIVRDSKTNSVEYVDFLYIFMAAYVPICFLFILPIIKLTNGIPDFTFRDSIYVGIVLIIFIIISVFIASLVPSLYYGINLNYIINFILHTLIVYLLFAKTKIFGIVSKQ